MELKPKAWTTFQHYSGRRPPWIKLHRKLLDDYAYACLPLASKALAPLLWLLASEYEKGTIVASEEELAFRLHISRRDFEAAIKPLIEQGFFECASVMLASCKQSAIPEEEGEIQVETEIDRGTVKRKIAEGFEAFWIAYPKRKGSNPKAPAFEKYKLAVKAGADPTAIVAAVTRCANELREANQIGTPYVPQAVTWLSQQRWTDYSLQAQPIVNGHREPPSPDAPTTDELRKRYANRPDQGTELRRQGSEILPVNGHEAVRNPSLHTGMRSMAPILRERPLDAVGDEVAARPRYEPPARAHDGPPPVAGVVRSELQKLDDEDIPETPF